MIPLSSITVVLFGRIHASRALSRPWHLRSVTTGDHRSLHSGVITDDTRSGHGHSASYDVDTGFWSSSRPRGFRVPAKRTVKKRAHNLLRERFLNGSAKWRSKRQLAKSFFSLTSTSLPPSNLQRRPTPPLSLPRRSWSFSRSYLQTSGLRAVEVISMRIDVFRASALRGMECRL